MAAHTLLIRRHTMRAGVNFPMNPCELTASITALANALACRLTEDELNLLGVSLTQLGDTLLTIATQRSICGHNQKSTRQTTSDT